MFADLVGQQGLRPATISLAKRPWQARWTVASPQHGVTALDIDFTPSGCPQELRATGRVGGLRAELRFSPASGGVDRGTMHVDWKYRPGLDSLGVELKILEFVRSLASGGTAQIEARDGQVKPVVVQVPAAEPDAYLETMWGYFTRLQVIERHIGRAIPRPAEAGGTDLNAIWEAAEVIERGGRTVTVDGLRMTLIATEQAGAFIEDIVAGRASLPYEPDDEFTIFGHVITLGTYALPFPPGRLTCRLDDTSADGEIFVQFEPDPAHKEVWATLQTPAR